MLKKNIIFSILFFIVNTLASLIIAKISIEYLGTEGFGVWVLLTQILLIGMFIEGVMLQPITSLYSRNEININKIFIISKKIGYFILYCAIIFSITVFYFGYEIKQQNDVSIFIIILLLSQVFHVLSIVYNGILAGEDENFKVQISKIFSRIIQLIFCISTMEYIGTSSLVIGILIFYILTFVLLKIQTKSLKIKNNDKVINNEKFKTMCLSIFKSRLISLPSEPILKNFSASAGGLTSVAYLEISQKANSAYTGLLSFTLFNLISHFNKITNGNEIYNTECSKFRLKIYVLTLLVVSTISTGLIYFGEWLLNFWIGIKDKELMMIYTSFIISYSFHSLSLIDLNILISYGKSKIVFHTSVIVLVFLIFSAFLTYLIDSFGHIQFIIIYLCGIVVSSIYTFFYSQSFYKKINVEK